VSCGEGEDVGDGASLRSPSPGHSPQGGLGRVDHPGEGKSRPTGRKKPLFAGFSPQGGLVDCLTDVVEDAGGPPGWEGHTTGEAQSALDFRAGVW
jgi:hypothetical protein